MIRIVLPSMLAWMIAHSPATSAQQPDVARAPEPARDRATAAYLVAAPMAIVGIGPEASIDSRDEWMAGAAEELLTWRLRRARAGVILPTIRCYQARRELQDTPTSPLPTWDRVLPLLGAKRQLRGAVGGTPDALTIRLELVELAHGPVGERAPRVETHVLARGSVGPGKFFDVVNEATRWCLEKLGATRISSQTEALILTAPATTPSAVEFWVKSVQAARADNMKDAMYFAEQSLQYDGKFLPTQLHLSQLEWRLVPAARANAAIRLRQLAEIARKSGDLLDLAEVEHAQGSLQMITGSYDSAQVRYESALGFSREAGDPYGEIGALNSLADLFMQRQPSGESAANPDARRKFSMESLARAAEYQEQLIQRLRALGDVIAEAPANVKLALIFESRGETDRVIDLHRRTLAVAQAAGSKRGEATAWMLMGQTFWRQKNRQPALDSFNKCLELAEGDARLTARMALGELYQDPGMPMLNEALEQFEKARAELTPTGDMQVQLRCLVGIANARHKLGQTSQAIQTMEEAIDIAHALNIPEEEAMKKQLQAWKAGR